MKCRLTRSSSVSFCTAVFGTVLMIGSTADIWPLLVIYNASASVPLGWYAVDSADVIRVGDLVVARPPIAAGRLLVERGYLIAGVPIVKFVKARAGQQVCREGDAVTIDASPVGQARDSDGAGRKLPRWSGCRVLGPNEVFLFNPAAPSSFDGRYFGPVSIASIIGKATPLWTW